MVAACKSVLCLVSFHRKRENWERQVSSPGRIPVCFVRSGAAFLALMNCLAQAGLVWDRIRCNNLRGEERQDDF